ncbi:MAG: helix-turn-helix transcriptional regulator [Oscillibacter sp.]|nr:helix-turn-helix transcriptional regulator [Oscillibacter sp.]
MRIVQMPKFSARLKELRKEKGAKQKDMAELLDCTYNHYQQIEYGNVNIPSLTLEVLADYFEVSTDYLLGRSDDRRTL